MIEITPDFSMMKGWFLIVEIPVGFEKESSYLKACKRLLKSSVQKIFLGSDRDHGVSLPDFSRARRKESFFVIRTQMEGNPPVGW